MCSIIIILLISNTFIVVDLHCKCNNIQASCTNTNKVLWHYKISFVVWYLMLYCVSFRVSLLTLALLSTIIFPSNHNDLWTIVKKLLRYLWLQWLCNVSDFTLCIIVHIFHLLKRFTRHILYSNHYYHNQHSHVLLLVQN